MTHDHTTKPALKDEYWMTNDEVLALFKISRSTLYRWCKTKQLPYTSMGGIRYYPKWFILKLMRHNMKNKDLSIK